MNVLVRFLVGGVAGWLTGKALEIEGRVSVQKESHVRDIVFGVVGGMLGETLFFWIVIGPGNVLSEFSTAVIGAIAMVGLTRLIAGRRRLAG